MRKKVEILDFPKNNGNLGIRISVLVEKFDVGKKYVSNIMSYKKEIYKTWVENKNDKCKLINSDFFLHQIKLYLNMCLCLFF